MSSTPHIQGLHHKVRMGLGEAILRLVQVEELYRRGLAAVPEHMLEERNLLITALNQYSLDIGFDCNADGVPDTVEVFEQAATTSCCRILPHVARKAGGGKVRQTPVKLPDEEPPTVDPVTPQETEGEKTSLLKSLFGGTGSKKKG